MSRQEFLKILATECEGWDAEETAYYIAQRYGLSLREVWNLMQRYDTDHP